MKFATTIVLLAPLAGAVLAAPAPGPSAVHSLQARAAEPKSCNWFQFIENPKSCFGKRDEVIEARTAEPKSCNWFQFIENPKSCFGKREEVIEARAAEPKSCNWFQFIENPKSCFGKRDEVIEARAAEPKSCNWFQFIENPKSCFGKRDDSFSFSSPEMMELIEKLESMDFVGKTEADIKKELQSLNIDNVPEEDLAKLAQFFE